jgi:uncharacterized protein with GYD domain
MPMYMFQGRYTSAAIAALVQKPEDRTPPVRELVESCGGKLEGFWITFGDTDYVGIVQLPDAKSAAAFSLKVGAGGGTEGFKTVEVLTWPQAVRAMKKAGSAKYRPPVPTK